MVFADNEGSAGTRLTLRTCDEIGRPCLVNPSRAQIRAFLAEHSIGVLNIAGNRESTAPGLRLRVQQHLYLSLRP